MKAKILYILFFLTVAIFFNSDSRSVSAKEKLKRVRFQVTTVGESASERKILAQTTIEGLPGTDFSINLQTGNFKMEAGFLSDLVSEDRLKIRANLNTRRFYGNSPANLPLYEEDAQKQTLELEFNESVVLLPFGRGGAETLKIEITPTFFYVSPTDEDARKLTIKFDKPLSSGEINIQATKTPHRFAAEAVLLADGMEIARGNAICLLAEESEIILRPLTVSENQNYAARLTINKFTKSRPQDLVGFDFGFYRAENQSVPVMPKGAGIGVVGGELVYPLENKNLPDGRHYELRFKIRLDEKEN